MDSDFVERTIDVLCVGEALVDLFPSELGRPLEEIGTFHRHVGGAPCNVALGLGRLGIRSAINTQVGNDPFGRYLIGAVSADGVDVSGISVHGSARTGITFVSISAGGERSFLYYRHPSADMLWDDSCVDIGLIRRAKVAHFGSSLLAREPSRSAMLLALAEARRAGCLISVDPNWRPHLWSSAEEAQRFFRPLLEGADLVKVSDDEIGPLFGLSDPAAATRHLRSWGVEAAIVTCGPRGSVYEATCGRGALPATPLLQGESVIDTTGAGDAFVAGTWRALFSTDLGRSAERFDLARLTRAELERSLSCGHWVASRVITTLSATQGLPRVSDLPAQFRTQLPGG